MTNPTHNLIVITGGPGAGKTTLLAALHRAGHPVAPEAGRAIIRDQTAIGGPALPWTDPVLFAELMLCWELRSYRWALGQSRPVFFDHALPCLPGYWRLLDRPVPAHVTAAVTEFRYRRAVFIAPPWPEIYHTDAERRQDRAEARRTYDAMVAVYPRLGYELIELPRCDVPGRVRFVLDHLADAEVTVPAPTYR